MERKKYSAGAVKLSFWFSEFRKVITLMNSGNTLQEIKKMNLAENIFSAPTRARAVQIFNTVATRVKSLDESFYQLFSQSDIINQKLINLIAVMESDILFFCFIYEVYREKLIIGVDELTGSDFGLFFTNKQLESEKAARWTDYTLKKLGSSYQTMLLEAGLLEKVKGARKIKKPIPDKSLEDCLKANGMEKTLHALTGVR